MKKLVLFVLTCISCLQLPAQITTTVNQKNHPKIIVHDGGNSYPLQLSNLSVDVTVTGNIAVTTYNMTFCNSENRVLEGELEFPLGESQTVSRFAMEVNGVLREGVVVEKAKGRITFEKIERRRVDPGLLEQTQGNVFRSRVYPIPANGTKTLVIAYEQEIKDINHELTYMLPLKFNTKVAHFAIQVEVMKNVFKLDSAQNKLKNMVFDHWNDVYKAHAEFDNYLPDKQLAIVIPHTGYEQNVYTEPIADQSNLSYFYIQTNPKIMRVQKALPDKVVLLWDASGSSTGRDTARELKVLEEYLKKVGNVDVKLIVFRNEADDPIDFQIKDGNSTQLLKYLRNIAYDGGTQLGVLNLKEFQCNEIILFSDGMSNFGETEIKLSNVPVMVINSSAIADYSYLNYIASATGGQFINLSECGETEALKKLITLEYHFISSDYKKSLISETYPSIPTSFNNSFTLAGKLTGKSAKILLNFGVGKKIMHTDTLIIEKDRQSSSTGTLGRIWAEKKLAEVDMQYEKNKDEITALGKMFSIVTRNTSLIVLDRIEDYVEHQIVPPKDMQKEYFTLLEARNSNNQKALEDHLEEVVRSFEQRKEWWNKIFPEKIKEPKPPKPRIRNSRATSTPAPNYPSHDRGTITIRNQNGSGLHVSGTVTDIDTNEGIPGVNIIVKGTARGTVSDFNGHYSFDIPANSVLTYTFVGYISEEVTVGSASIIDIALAPDIRRLDEVVVIGYGSQTRSDITGSVSRVNYNPVVANNGERISIKINEWNPQMPYLERLKAVTSKEYYSTYLTLKAEYENSPSFFLDVADFFNKNGENKLALRILSNIAELKIEDQQLLRVLAHRLHQLGYYKLAVKVFRQVLIIREEEPQSYRDLALALADDKCYQEAVDVLYSLIQKRWDSRFPGIELIAVGEMNEIIAKSNSVDVSKIDSRLLENLLMDIRIILNWDADNCDMDLWVTGPDGEKCYYGNKHTKMGGMISNDFTQGYGPEEFVIRKGLPGTYKIEVNYYGSSQQKITGPTTIQAELYTNYGKKSQKKEAITMRLSDQKDVIKIGELVLKR